MKSSSPCPRCGWKYGFHICVDLSKPAQGEYVQKPKMARTKPKRAFSDAHREAMSAAQKARWEQRRANGLGYKNDGSIGVGNPNSSH